MNNPWDVPPWPTKGGDTPEAVYQSIGAALTTWERLEDRLASIFSFFVGSENSVAYRAFGTIATFRGRVEMLEAAAGEFFAIESEFAKFDKRFRPIMKKCRGFAGRRNEIAHGIIMQLDDIYHTKGEHPGYCLVPRLWASNKRTPNLKPKYVYSPEMIDKFRDGFRLTFRQTASLLESMLNRKMINESEELP